MPSLHCLLSALLITACAMLSGLSTHALAQSPSPSPPPPPPPHAQAQAWPQRTVKLLVPLPPGTSVDVSARVYAERLASIWGHAVVVENLPGADGLIAMREFVGRRDDHTLMYSFAGLITINPVLYATLPYDAKRDLVPIAVSSENYLAVAASPKLGVNTLGDLLKAHGSNGTGLHWAATPGLTYFAFASLAKQAIQEMVYVPYRDFAPALSDLREGRIAVVSTGLTQLLPQAQAGHLKLLTVFNRTRSPQTPNVPTTAELGYPDLVFDGTTGFFGWRDISNELRARIAADVRTVASQPLVAARFESIGVVARSGTPAEFESAIEDQRLKVAKVAAVVGIRPAP
jgi:tripartite-type tricarboxylate transporter receptor subunit TctC